MRTRASKWDTPIKSGYFTAVNLSSMKTVAHKHRHSALVTSFFSGVNIDDRK